jgi:MbtH protein
MANPFEDKSAKYLIVANDEGQYSLWPTFRAPPQGWIAVSPAGGREECVDWIEAHWTDMRPISLRSAVDIASKPLL